MGVKLLIDKIADNSPSFKSAYFDGFILSDEDIKGLSNALENNSNLNYLSLLDCRLTIEQIERLAQGIEKNHSLTGIGIEIFENDDEKIKIIFDKMTNYINRNNGEKAYSALKISRS